MNFLSYIWDFYANVHIKNLTNIIIKKVIINFA